MQRGTKNGALPYENCWRRRLSPDPSAILRSSLKEQAAPPPKKKIPPQDIRHTAKNAPLHSDALTILGNHYGMLQFTTGTPCCRSHPSRIRYISSPHPVVGLAPSHTSEGAWISRHPLERRQPWGIEKAESLCMNLVPTGPSAPPLGWGCFPWNAATGERPGPIAVIGSDRNIQSVPRDDSSLGTGLCTPRRQGGRYLRQEVVETAHSNGV